MSQYAMKFLKRSVRYTVWSKKEFKRRRAHVIVLLTLPLTGDPDGHTE
jgi:hypothetical protein